MACPGVGPCEPWDLDLSCCLVSGGFPDPCLADGGQQVPQSIIDSSILAASQFLWAWTGRQFGCCQVTLSLCPTCPSGSGCCIPGFNSEPGYGFPWYPAHLADGTWINVSCDSCNACACDRCIVPLPYPTCSVDEVFIDGVILDPNSYSVYNFKELAYSSPVSGVNCETKCGDTVTLTYGRPVPEPVRLAAAAFACQLIRACVGAPCQLPQRLTSLSRQGVSMSFLDPMDFIDKGKTGIYLVDLAIKTYNPNMLMQRARVYSPDTIGKWKVETWSPGDPTGPQCT